MIKLFCLPIEGMNVNAISGTGLYGKRINPITKKQQTHHGVDINRMINLSTINLKPIIATAEGTVIVSKMQGNGKGYGNYIVIKHSGFYTLYAHLNSRKVATGQSVKAGAVIGTVGSTGNSTGPHLHFGICTSYSMADPDGSSVWLDPLPYLKAIATIKISGEGEEEVKTTTINAKMNGKDVKLTSIIYNDENYIRIRDLADAQTDDKLEVSWNNTTKTVEILSK